MKKMYSTSSDPAESLNILICKLATDCYIVGFSYFRKKDGRFIQYIEAENHAYQKESDGVKCTLNRARRYMEEDPGKNSRLINELWDKYFLK